MTTPAALWEPLEVSEQGPATLAEAFPEEAEGTTFNHWLACSDTMDRDDTMPHVPHWAAFLHEFPELSEYAVEGGGMVVVRLGDSEDTFPDVSISPTVSPSPTSSLEVPLLGARGEWRLPTGQAVLEQLPDTEDTTVAPDVPNCSTEVPHELPEVSKYVAEDGYPKELSVVVGLGAGEDIVPDFPKVPILTSSLNKLSQLLEYRAKERTALVWR